jgi:uncharacterized protein (TIGR02271 family)
MLLNRESALTRYQGLSEGTPVYSRDDEKLGKVRELGDDSFTIEKGFFFPKDFLIRYDDIQDIQDNGIHLNISKDELSEWRNESYAGWNQVDDINQGRLNAQPKDQYRNLYQDRTFAGKTTEQVRVPVSEEELQVSKTMREAGQVRLRKIVHTELRHFTVPVMREEVRVERVPVGERGATGPMDQANAFKETEINVPVMEEEVTISKRPVTKEEVRVSKERTTEERPVEGEIRKEEVRVEKEGDIKRKKTA